MNAMSYGELDSLDCELLPRRVLMSLIDLTFFDQRSYDVNMPRNDGPNGGTTVAYACQATRTEGTPGLVGSLGLGQAPSSSMTCVPAQVTTR